MAINVGKSACMPIGWRYNVKCINISTLNSREILWCDKIKYFGIDLIAARVFKYSYANAKRKFYRAFNAVFGKVGRTAPEEVIIQLLKTKNVYRYYYGLEACPINRDQVRSLDCAVHSCFRKIFSMTDQSVVEQCMTFYECHHVKDTIWRYTNV